MGKMAVTGAYSYSGKYIARQLLAGGCQVITLTGHPERPDPFSGQVRAFPYNFDDRQALEKSLAGVDVLYNTYWVRFNYAGYGFDRAVENSRRLFEAAARAGVRRVVHLSVSNPDPASPLPYFRGKAQVEQSLRDSGLSFAILRPTLIFGREDILINNIAYLLRRFPIFAIPGDGQYRLQPAAVEDLAEIAVRAGGQQVNQTIDVAGPEVFTFESLLRQIAACTGQSARLVKSPTGLALAASQVIGWALGDVTLTREEALGLMANLLVSKEPPAGKRRLSDWLAENAETVGRQYASELARHFNPGDRGQAIGWLAGRLEDWKNAT